jgi:hypothetical protein
VTYDESAVTVTVLFEVQMKNARELPKVMLRIDQALKERLQESAQRNFRSLNSEINVRLNESYEAEQKEKAPGA